MKRITAIFGTARGRTFRHDIGAAAAIVGPNGIGKSTALRAAFLALYGTDGERKQNADIFSAYAAGGARVAFGVRLDDGTEIERSYTAKRDGVTCDIRISPAGRPKTNADKEKRIVELVGAEPPIIQSDFAGDLASAKNRAEFLAGFAASDLSPELAEEAKAAGASSPTINGVVAALERAEQDAKDLAFRVEDRAGGARSHDEVAKKLADARAACPHSQADVDKLDASIAKLNADIQIAVEKAREREILKAELDAMKEPAEPEPADVDAAEAALKDVDDRLEKDRTAKLKALRKEEKDAKAAVQKVADAIAENNKAADAARSELEAAKSAIETAEQIEKSSAEIRAIVGEGKCESCGKAIDAAAMIDKFLEDTATDRDREPMKKRLADAEAAALSCAERAKQLLSEHVEAIATVDAAGKKIVRAAEFQLHEHPDHKEAEENVVKARRMVEARQGWASAKAVYDEKHATLTKKLSAPAPDVDALTSNRNELKAKRDEASNALDEIRRLAASAAASAGFADEAERLRGELETARARVKALSDLRGRAVVAALQDFVNAGAEMDLDPHGRSFAVETDLVRGKIVAKIGVRDEARGFIEYDGLSAGEKIAFAASFALAVSKSRGAIFRPILLDDVDTVSTKRDFRTRLLARVADAVQNGFASQAIVCGHDVEKDAHRVGFHVIDLWSLYGDAAPAPDAVVGGEEATA